LAENDIRHEAAERGGVFFIESGGQRVGELTYRMAGNTAIVDHTWVDRKLRGGGDARRLVDAAVQWARTEQLKLSPACSYVRIVLERTPEYADVRKV
jgi:uncharacterized protein